VDTKLGVIYYGTGEATSHPAGLTTDAILAIDIKTGKRIWHQQLVHHDIWDWDLASQPVLLDVTVDGRRVKAVAQITKQAFTFVFDRVTGKPIWPIEERPVPASTVPGEITSPTQPFPTKPAQFDRNSIGPDDVNDLTPEIKSSGGTNLPSIKRS
jgi:quinoprotein glucose dehydrogenase